MRCSGSRPCERCVRRNDECAFATNQDRVVVSRKYLDSLKARLHPGDAGPASIAATSSPAALEWWRTTSDDVADLADVSASAPNARTQRPAISISLNSHIDPSAHDPQTISSHEARADLAQQDPTSRREWAYVSGSDERRLRRLRLAL